MKLAHEADAVIFGAVGGPKWDDPKAKVRPEQGLLRIRKALGLYANLRPVKAWPALLEASPLKRDRIENVDLLFVRELTGGIYFGEPRGVEIDSEGRRRGFNTYVYREDEIERIAYSKDIQPAGENIVAMSQHAHAPTMAVILLVIGALTLTTRFTARFVGFVLFVAAFGLFVDMAGWWITREVAWFAHAIVIGGIAYAMGTSLLGALVVLDCVIPAKRCPADG